MIDLLAPDFADTPVSPGRPDPDFAPSDPAAPPALSVVTAFYEAGPLFRETARSVLGQSLQQWEWILVDDGSRAAASRALLEELERSDPRIRVLRHPENRGRSAARNSGFAAARSELVYPLDQDDLLEPTALEKTLWHLLTHPELAFANGWSVAFGAREFVWTRGFEQGPGFLEENFATGRALVRKSAFLAAGGYDEALREGFEDWDFWLRCASRGLWGGTIPECLDWHRRRHAEGEPGSGWEAPGRLEAFRAGLPERFPALTAGAFPDLPTPQRPDPEAASGALPCPNLLAKRGPRLLVVLPGLELTAATRYPVGLARALERQGFALTLAAGLEAEGEGEWLPRFARVTPDVHVLSRFLEPEWAPLYLRYLIGSRRPDAVLLPQGELARHLLPYLRLHCPDPLYLVTGWEADEVGACAPGAAGSQDLVDCRIAPTRSAAAPGLAAGAGLDRVRVIPPAFDASAASPSAGLRRELRAEWGIREAEPVLLCRTELAPVGRPRLLLRALLELERRGVPFRALVLGEGPERARLEALAAQSGLGERVRWLGRDSPELGARALRGCDLCLVPGRGGFASAWILEAMASGLPVVSPDLGGRAELVGEGGAVVAAGDAAAEVAGIADALEPLLREPEARAAAGQRARERVLSHSDPESAGASLAALVEELQGSRPPLHPPPDPARARDGAAAASEVLRLERAALEARRHVGALARALRDRTESLESLRDQVQELERARAWLEEQRESLGRELQGREQAIAELREWNRQLDEARVWLDDQWRSALDLAEARGLELERRGGSVRELEEAKAWLEEQRQSWMRAAQERAATIDQEKEWIRELEEAKAWLDEQRQSWMREAEGRGAALEAQAAQLQAQAARLEAQAAQLQALEGSRRELAARLESLGRLSAWRLLRLRLSVAWPRALGRAGAGEPDRDD